MKIMLFVIVNFLSVIFALPFIIYIKVFRIAKITNVSIFMSRVPFLFGDRVRYYYYKHTLSSLGKGVVFKYGSYVQYRDVKIGNNVLIGYYCSLGEVSIGNDVLLGGYVNILSGKNQHSYDEADKLIRLQTGKRVRVNIGNDSWIGSNAVVMADIGDRVVIGAGSVVSRCIPSNRLAVGNPATVLKEVN